MLETGFSKRDITVFEPGQIMFGWVHPNNVSLGVAQPLYARAMVVRDPDAGTQLAYVCSDLCLITQALRDGVIEALSAEHPELGLGAHEVMLTATHTHSGPSGYSRYFLYNVLSPLSRRVLDTLVGQTVAAIVEAHGRLQPSRVVVHQGSVPLSEPVAFNRSLAAYNLNDDVVPVTWERRDEAVDRTMTILRSDAADGDRAPLGMIAWFGTHGTSVHAENQLLHPDNKGTAARHFEGDLRSASSDFVAIFAQTSAGDVSPNYRYDARRRKMIGRYADDFESADFAGAIQARSARRIFDAAPAEGRPVTGGLDGRLHYNDMGSLELPPELTRGLPGQRTAPPTVGVGAALGTDEGPGPLHAAPWVNHAVIWLTQRHNRARERSLWARSQGQKAPLIHLAPHVERRVLGRFGYRFPFFPRWLDPTIAFIRECDERGVIGDGPWAPSFLPVQILRLGHFAVAGLPNEPTTVAARRLRATLEPELADLGIDTIVINGYANGHCQYLTTYEEYQHQGYEGANTHFGHWTLAGFRLCMRDVARELRSAGPGSRPTRAPSPDWDDALLEQLRDTRAMRRARAARWRA